MVPDVCKNLPSPANGNVMTNATLRWAVANYSCDLCYMLEEDEERQCQYNVNQKLMWTGRAPRCCMYVVIGERERANLVVRTARILRPYVVQLRMLQDYALLFIRKDLKISHAAYDVVRIQVRGRCPSSSKREVKRTSCP